MYRRLVNGWFWRSAATATVVAALYFAAARLGLSMAILTAQVSPVWPATGLALALVLRLGNRAALGIALGAFAANYTASEPWGTAVGIAIGNTLEAVCGARLLSGAGFSMSLGRVRDVFFLLLYGAMLSTAISATIGVSSLCLGGVQPWSEFGATWQVWWLGDAVGAVVVAPVLLTWRFPLHPWPPRRLAEALALVASMVGVGLVVFSPRMPDPADTYSLQFALFPFIIWAALRFGQQGAAGVTLLASALAIWGTLDQSHTEEATIIHGRLLILQTYMGVVSITALLLAAALSERRDAATELTEQREWLEVTLHSIADAVVATDAGGRVTFINPCASAICGWGSDALGKPATAVIRMRQSDTGISTETLLRRATSGNATRLEQGPAVLASRDGQEVFVEYSASPIRNAQGDVAGAVLVFRDVGPRRAADRRVLAMHTATRILAASESLRQAAPQVLEAICRALDWQVGGFWILDEADGAALRGPLAGRAAPFSRVRSRQPRGHVCAGRWAARQGLEVAAVHLD